MDDRTRIPALDAWRGLGVLFLFHLLFFGRHIEQTMGWSTGPDLPGRLAGRLADLFFTSGVLGLDMLFMVSGALVFRKAAGKASPLSFVTGRYARLAPFIAVSGVALVAYGGLHPLDYLASLLLLQPANVPQPLVSAFARADAFLVFSVLVAGWLALARRRPGLSGGLAAMGAAGAGLLSALGPGWVPLNGHFLAFFWGAAASWAADCLDRSGKSGHSVLSGRAGQTDSVSLSNGTGQSGQPGSEGRTGQRYLPVRPGLLGRIPGWAGAVLMLAAMMLARKLSALRGDEFYFLMDGRGWRTLGILLPVQALLACGLAVSLRGDGFWLALRPLTALGRRSYCFFMAFVLWSFPLSGNYAHLLESPVWSLAALYAITLGSTLAVSFVLAPFLEKPWVMGWIRDKFAK